MEKLGLVSRQPDPRDARVGYASLTDAGQQLLKYALASIEPIAKEAIQKVPVEQIGPFLLALGELAGINLSNN
jgi:DNA-binding MarR family transcriptional regulator